MQAQYVLNIERALELGILTVLVPPDDGGSGNDEGSIGDALYEKLLALLPRAEDVGQRHLLRFIQERPQGTTVPAIAEHFSVTTSTVVGIINGGLQRNIKKAGFAEIDPILMLVKEGGQWHYHPGEVLKRQRPIPE